MISQRYFTISRRPIFRMLSDKANQSQTNAKDVKGLSSSCIEPAKTPVGPGVDPQKTGAYKVPEYYCYNNMSFFEAEVEMAHYRMPQPSALKK